MFSIALKTLRTKWRDYTVLFAGLIIAVAIFYMFSAIATNKDFLQNNSTISIIVPLFFVGEILLGVITFVYLNFANAFLLRLRQSEYGLMSMLGAKKQQIGSLLMTETLLLGFVAVVIGELVGMSLTAVSGNYLMAIIDITLPNWSVISSDAIITTFGFFMVVFLLNGFYNQVRLAKLDTLTLLNADRAVKQPKRHPVWDAILGLVGFAMLAGSYWLIPTIIHVGLLGIIGALVINVWGTYWLMSRTLKLVTFAIRGSRFGMHGLRSFLNGQLLFRLPDYQRLLATVAVMFGLGLGAMSVGQGYYNSLPREAAAASAFTMALTDQKSSTAELSGITWRATYHYVVSGKEVVFVATDFDKAKLPEIAYGLNEKNNINWLNSQDVIAQKNGENLTLQGLAAQILNQTYDAKYSVVATENELAAVGTVKEVRLLSVSDMVANQAMLRKLAENETKNLGTPAATLAGSFGMLSLLKNAFGGLEFMGLFLGVAFLAMIASTLMFKTLSGVADDKLRYRILRMVGVTKTQMTKTIAKDLGLLFYLPLAIGVLDVAFGLQMFKPLMSDPYEGFWLSLGIVMILYTAYYAVTVILYRKLVQD